MNPPATSEPGDNKTMQSVSIPGRLPAIDLARGVALLAMTVYHFSWDLALFELLDPHFPHTAGMVWFARLIAGSFLFLVGFNLVLAHRAGIRWRKFYVRLAMIVGAAALITLVTYFATPDAFIFFGILHSIAFASILGLAFLRLPWWANGVFVAIFLFGSNYLRSAIFDPPVWWWTGLSARPLISNDFVPVFPFFGLVLAGIAAADAALKANILPPLRHWRADGRTGRALRLIGRHSLAFYLVHQPILIALLAGVLWLSGNI